MINMPSDFNTARAYDGGSGDNTPLSIGGHICRIRDARLDVARTGTQMLVIEFDISEGGDFDGYYAKRFERSLKFNSAAKWPGTFRAPITTREGNTSGYFKGLVTAVEESNPPFRFQGEETTLRGKAVGFNFGEEEWLGRDNQVHVSVKPFYAVSAATVNAGIAPPARKLYKGPQPVTAPSEGFTEVSPDDMPPLPF